MRYIDSEGIRISWAVSTACFYKVSLWQFFTLVIWSFDERLYLYLSIYFLFFILKILFYRLHLRQVTAPYQFEIQTILIKITILSFSSLNSWKRLKSNRNDEIVSKIRTFLKRLVASENRYLIIFLMFNPFIFDCICY